MPWQQHVVDVALEIDPVTGRLAYREVIVTVPRQSGKTTLTLSVSTQRALGFNTKQRVIYTAQNRNDARQKWEDDHVVALEASPFKSLFRVRKTNGNEAIIWRNGSMHGITSTTEKAGHGMTLDLAIIDEAFAMIDARLEQAFKPAMVTRPQPQLWIVSTAGTPESTYLRQKVENGRARCEAGLSESVAYFEWSAPEDADPEDRDVWRACMPALGHTVTEDAIGADFASMKLVEFRRAYLNQWCDRNATDPVIDMDIWAKCADMRSQVGDPVAFAIDTTPDRRWTSIAIGGQRADGKQHVEVIEHRSGTSWVVARMTELIERWRPCAVVVDPGAAAGSLLPEFAEHGIAIELPSYRDAAQACGSFYDAVMDGDLCHLDQEVLNAALGGAKKRPLGDAWAWSRKDSSTDISPLVASTLALWGFATRDPDPPAAAPLVAWR